MKKTRIRAGFLGGAFREMPGFSLHHRVHVGMNLIAHGTYLAADHVVTGAQRIGQLGLDLCTGGTCLHWLSCWRRLNTDPVDQFSVGGNTLEPSSRDELTPTFRLLDTFVRKLLDEGIQDGSITPCDTKITTFSIFGTMHWLARWYRPGGELSPQEIADRVFTLFDKGLRPVGGRDVCAAPPGR